ncbi:MAG TPA: tRNA lysidine(34) synthetase TilS [Streptosporangiaceae bacterium]
MGPHPAVAAIRHAIRTSLAGLSPGDVILVACSGGADSLALAAAVAFEAPKAGLLAGGITVDHGLQAGSADRARQVSATLAGLGLAPVSAVGVTVAGPADSASYPGPEAAARQARYAALDEAAAAAGAVAVLLGHTLDDQAESVLLGLHRGSGARSLAGMAPRSGRYLRPLLAIRRAQTTAACAALGLAAWQDPQNEDPAFTRARVRTQLMPVLEQTLGPGVAEALARTASLLHADADALDAMAAAEASQLPADGLPADRLALLPAAIRHRILRAAALAAGSRPGDLSERHIASLDRLVTDWHGQRWTNLPGGISCQRRCGRLLFSRSEDLSGRE